MKRRLIHAGILVGFWVLTGYTRVFLVGSNPSLTILAFPQDIFKFPSENAFYYITYENKPWWGDVDDPPNKPMNESPNRPNNTYLATGESYGPDENGNTFKHRAFVNAIQNQIGFNKDLTPTVKTRFDLRYSGWAMRSRASGSIENVTFDYVEKNAFHEAYLTSILGFMAHNVPVGIKLGLGGVYTSKPDLEFDISTGASNRLLWGWSALQGANILNSAEAVAHAEYQDRYSIGPLYEFDIQAGATIPRLVLGGRFRYHFGSLDTYNWQESSERYRNDESDKLRNITGRLYGNRIWSEGDNYRFATLALSRLTHIDSTEVSVTNPDAEIGLVRGTNNFVFQINPNISLYPWKTRQTYIDAAILCNYSYTKYSYTGPVWVGGGQKKSYVNTDVSASDEYWWQDCSYSHQNFFEVALDLNPVFPVFGNKDQSAAVGVLLLLWTRFKWTNKYYGTNIITGSDLDFDVESVRKNLDHESWLNSAFNLIYRRGSYVFRLDIGQPLIYSLTPRTRVIDKASGEIQYEKRLENMWVSQAGVKLGFFVTTTLDNLHGFASKKRLHSD